MMEPKNSMNVVALVLVLASASAASAQPQPPGGPPKVDVIAAEHADEIGIDATTVDAIGRIVAAAQAELEQLHQTLRQAVESGDREAFAQADRALREKMRAVIEQVRALLTVEQWDALRRFLPPPPPPPLEKLVADFAAQAGVDAAVVEAIQEVAAAARSELDDLRHVVERAAAGGEPMELARAVRALHEREDLLLEEILGQLTRAQWQAIQQLLPPPPPPPPRPAQ